MCTNDHHLPVVTLASLYGAATSWHCNKFLNPARDGAVLPVLHLNQYKIANPTLLARISDEELLNLLRGYGYTPHMVSGDDPPALDGAPGRIAIVGITGGSLAGKGGLRASDVIKPTGNAHRDVPALSGVLAAVSPDSRSPSPSPAAART